jgi:hypothetical protein
MRILSNQIGRKNPWEQESSFKNLLKMKNVKQEGHTLLQNLMKKHQTPTRQVCFGLLYTCTIFNKCLNQMVQKPRIVFPL